MHPVRHHAHKRIDIGQVTTHFHARASRHRSPTSERRRQLSTTNFETFPALKSLSYESVIFMSGNKNVKNLQILKPFLIQMEQNLSKRRDA